MSGPTVTLTFAGDSTNLQKTMEKVGSSTRDMGDDVGKASSRVRESGAAFDSFSEKADATDTRAMGFRDTITGLSDGFKGLTDTSLSTEERLLMLGMGIGDLASGFVNLLIPAVKSLALFMKGPLLAAFSFVAAHPLVFALLALVAIFVLLWTKSETFRNIVIGVFHAVWAAVQNVAGWIVGRWQWAVGVLRGFARNIGSFFSNIWDGLTSGAKWALNFVIDMLNGAIWALNKLVQGINVIPGVNLGYIPYIPKFHQGGKVPGAPGTETLAILQAGETVTPAGRTVGGDGGGGSMTFRGNTDSAVATLIMHLIRAGKIQLT